MFLCELPGDTNQQKDIFTALREVTARHRKIKKKKKIIDIRGQDRLLVKARVGAIYYVGAELAVSCKPHVAWRCPLPRGGVSWGQEENTYTHTVNLSLNFPLYLPHRRAASVSFTQTDTGQCQLHLRVMEGADKVVAVRVIFTSANVILSIKAKRTAASHNSQQAGSSTAVQNSSSSEQQGR